MFENDKKKNNFCMNDLVVMMKFATRGETLH